jgi:hypothetical protein
VSILFAARTGLEQRPQFDKLVLSSVAAGKTGSAFELTDDGEKRTILMMRRTEIADASVRLVSGPFLAGACQT